MRKIFYTISIITISSVIYSACSKAVEGRTDNIPALNPVSQDLNAGTWKLILLSRPDSFVVAPPALPGTPAYGADLNEIKGYQQSLSPEQKEKIRYWGSGGVLRWNEIIRELVAKHNLPPYQNEDGTYPIPNAQ